MKTPEKVQSKSKIRGKHPCYYGYTNTPWYRVYCPLCEKILKSNLIKLSLMIFGGVTILGAFYYLS